MIEAGFPILIRTPRGGPVSRPNAMASETDTVSQSAAGDLRQTGLAAGMDVFLTKPVGAEDLARVIARWAGEGSA